MFGREPAGARLKVLTTLLPDEGKEEEEAHNQVVVGDHNEVGGEEQGVHLEMGSDEKVTNGGGGYNLLMGMGNSHQPLDDSLLISGGMLATGGGQQSSSSAKHLYSFY
jgi:hypothetical protein